MSRKFGNKNFLSSAERKKIWPYRSKLEHEVAGDLDNRGIPFLYEQEKLKYTQPAKTRTYTPDIKIGNMYIEIKGDFEPQDRQKHLHIKESHPHLDIRFVFGNPNRTINPKSKTRYRDWAEQHGFMWAHRRVPKEWIDEAIGKQRQKRRKT